MSRIKVSSKVSSKADAKVWEALKLLAEAIRNYVRRRRIRPEVIDHLLAWIRESIVEQR